MLHGDPNPWRSLGHSSWYDSLSVLEDPTSDEFQQSVKSELHRWSKTLKPYEKQIHHWETAFREMSQQATPNHPDWAQERMEWLQYTIHIQFRQGHTLHVWFLTKDKTIVREYNDLSSFGVDPVSNLYFTIKDVGNGAETLKLTVYKDSAKKELWSHSPVGPNAVFSNQHLIFQTMENQLRYPGIVSAEKNTGNDMVLLFEEKDKRFQVELVQPPFQSSIFIKTSNALSHRIGELIHNHIHWVTPALSEHANGSGTTLIPIAKHIYGTNDHIVIGNRNVPLPPNEFLVQAVLHENCIVFTTTKLAKMALYSYNIESNELIRVYGKRYPNEIKIHTLSTRLTIEVLRPAKSSELYIYKDGNFHLFLKYPEPIHLPFFHYGTAVSKDGTRVPFTIVSKTENPKKLFVEGYGSYGISNRRGYPTNRLTWINQGYAYASSFARGGREDGDRWYDAGRTPMRKQNTFDDTAAVIQTVQKRFDIDPEHTIFYGRSAGGLLAANIAHQYSHLVGAVYTEVPYLDVLRTTTNPNLPLTQLEYDEFGNPANRPNDFRELQKISPVNSVPLAKRGSPIIVVKTALFDSQVLPYETLKWAKKLRGNDWTVFVGIDTDGGHFSKASNLYRALAEDAVLLTNPIQTLRLTDTQT